jgi:hypothetical protein
MFHLDSIASQSVALMFRRDREGAAVHWPMPLVIPEELEESEVPDFFKCSITLSIMREPAQTPAGMTNRAFLPFLVACSGRFLDYVVVVGVLSPSSRRSGSSCGVKCPFFVDRADL